MTDMGTWRSSSSYTQTDIIYSVENLPILHSHSTTLSYWGLLTRNGHKRAITAAQILQPDWRGKQQHDTDF